MQSSLLVYKYFLLYILPTRILLIRYSIFLVLQSILLTRAFTGCWSLMYVNVTCKSVKHLPQKNLLDFSLYIYSLSASYSCNQKLQKHNFYHHTNIIITVLSLPSVIMSPYSPQHSTSPSSPHHKYILIITVWSSLYQSHPTLMFFSIYGNNFFTESAHWADLV